MIKSDSIQKLAEALAKAQGEFPEIKRSKTVRVVTKAGKQYTFDYAPLEVIMAAIKPALVKHGLSILQTVDAERLVTTLLHSSGEFYSSGGTPIKASEDGPQAYGSALTYARRYDLTLLLGLASEDDDDAGAASGHQTTQVPKGPGVHAPSDGAAESLSEPQRRKVMGVVDEAKACYAASPLDCLAVLESAKFEPEESIYAWLQFDSKERAAMKSAKAKLKAA